MNFGSVVRDNPLRPRCVNLPGSAHRGSSLAKELHIYCDGATYHNGRPDCRAGWGLASTIYEGFYQCINKEMFGPVVTVKEHAEYVGAEKQSNQTGELTAMFWALQMAARVKNGLAIKIYSDSLYALNLTQLKWDAKCNLLLAKNCYRAYNENPNKRRISFHHVKGHSGDTFNDLADGLAKEGVWSLKTTRRK